MHGGAALEAEELNSHKLMDEESRAKNETRSQRTAAQQDTTRSIMGPKFVAYFKAKGMDPAKNLPTVEICLKILTISDINVKEHSFITEFIMMYDWLDYSLSRSKDDPEQWEDHFLPHLELHNCVSRENIGGIPTPRKKKNKKKDIWRITQTQRVAACLRTQYDLRLYPFDHQFLEIQLKSRAVSRGGGQKSLNVRLDNPVTWRGKKGHKLEEKVDWLSEWDIAKIDGAPDGKDQSKYRFQICVLRDSKSAFWNLVLSLACIILLSFTAFALSIEQLADRETVVMTMLLATMTFKFVLADHLPSVPYLTVMDRYVVQGLVTICSQGLAFAIFDVFQTYGDPYVYRTFGVEDFAEWMDMVFFVVLFTWQLWIHARLLALLHENTLENFLEESELFCVIQERKKVNHAPSSSYLKNYEKLQVYCSDEVYRPYPLPVRSDRYRCVHHASELWEPTSIFDGIGEGGDMRRSSIV